MVTLSTWKIFVLGRDKTPLPNCDDCREAGTEHDRETCRHLTCHGFYAATDSPDRIAQMHKMFPDHPWALRCGAASGVIVLDAEGNGEPSGVEVLDDWENWVGGWPLQETGLIALTPSGGVHRYYEYATGIRSRNRVLPGIDVKSDGGYVVLPQNGGSDGRRWVLTGKPAYPEGPMLDWLRAARGGRTAPGVGSQGHTPSYDYERFVREGCPGGVRDEFFNDMIFRLRKAGVGRGEAVVRVRAAWKICKQPPDATWYMPWDHVAYKIERIWRTVDADALPDGLAEWARGVNAMNEPTQVGRVTLVGRES